MRNRKSIERLDQECKVLGGLLFPGLHEPMHVRALRFKRQMGPDNWLDHGAVKFLRRCLDHWEAPKGKPATKLPIALHALDLRFADLQRWSWNVLPTRLCFCGAEEHGFQCRENIRLEVIRLEKVIAKLGIKFPTL
jgi:hypothetical protein